MDTESTRVDVLDEKIVRSPEEKSELPQNTL